MRGSSNTESLVGPGFIDRLAHSHRRAAGLVVAIARAGAFQGAGDREGIHLDRGGDLAGDEIERRLLGRAVVIRDLDRHVETLPDAMDPAVGLPYHPGVVVRALDPEGAGEVDEVVEPGLDRLGVGDEDSAAGLDDVLV